MIAFYRVRPHSVLFFRDSRPFSAGEQSLARLQFPPRITPFLGALRTKFLEELANKEKRKIYEIDRYEQNLLKISIIWFSLMKKDVPLIPIPFDLHSKWKILNQNRFITLNIENLKVPIKSKKEDFDKVEYITISGFKKYLDQGSFASEEIYPNDSLWEFENRVGLALSPESKTSERSRFYRITVARLKSDVSFLVGVEFRGGLNLPDSFTTRLGGEGHIAVWDKLDENKIKAQKKDSYPNLNELIALSHVPIKNDRSNGDFQVTNWCLNKLDAISGWDYKERHPKPLYKAVCPGAVLFTERNSGSESIETYEIDFNGEKILVIKDLILTQIGENGEKFYLKKYSPMLGEPNTLFIVKH